ncbi:MAG: hypothetical protein AAGF24_04650 [Cyanobacteria bacterium P01_H01_bin.121]
MSTELESHFSTPKRLGILGSMSFANPFTETICNQLGRYLADYSDLIVLTGGVAGIPEAVSRSLWQQRQTVITGGTSVYHIQPKGFEPWDYGTNLTAGSTMEARRKILATLAPVYLLLEGGHGAQQEATWALQQGALLIPVGCTGGAAQFFFEQMQDLATQSLKGAQLDAWQQLATYTGDAETQARAIATLVQGAFATQGYPLDA